MAVEPQGLSTLQVDAAAAGKRLDVYLAAQLPQVSRSKLQKLIAAGSVLVNGKPARAKEPTVAGDQVVITWSAPPAATLTPVRLPLAILYEDEHILVVDKPAGLAVHPGAGDTGPTLVQGLLYHCGQLGQSAKPAGAGDDPAAVAMTDWRRPGIVHRLDKDTTGVLVCAKTDRAHAGLAQQFHDKTSLRREYTALLDGAMAKDEDLYESYLYRDPANRLRFASMPPAAWQALLAAAGQGSRQRFRYAKSLFLRQELLGHRLTLAQVRLFTGRTHQIRVHAKALGLPVLGDPLYHHGTQLPQHFPAALHVAVAALHRQMLHASLLVLRHPISGEERRFSAPLPADFAHLLALARAL